MKGRVSVASPSASSRQQGFEPRPGRPFNRKRCDDDPHHSTGINVLARYLSIVTLLPI
jgi:hypothetical protein